MIKWEGSRKKNRCNITDSLRGHGDTCFVSRFIRQRMKIRWATPPTLTGKGWIWRPVGVLVYRRHNTSCGITWGHFRYSTTVDERVKIGKKGEKSQLYDGMLLLLFVVVCFSTYWSANGNQREGAVMVGINPSRIGRYNKNRNWIADWIRIESAFGVCMLEGDWFAWSLLVICCLDLPCLLCARTYRNGFDLHPILVDKYSWIV